MANKRREGWLMELAAAERNLIHEKGSHHELTLQARKAFSAAWKQVHAIQRCFGLPAAIKETN